MTAFFFGASFAVALMCAIAERNDPMRAFGFGVTAVLLGLFFIGSILSPMPY